MRWLWAYGNNRLSVEIFDQIRNILQIIFVAVSCFYFLLTEPGKCASSPCQNGGTCHELHGVYSCKCKTGYEGQQL